jgi:tetratricopeptide (TPR) repeat protein
MRKKKLILLILSILIYFSCYSQKYFNREFDNNKNFNELFKKDTSVKYLPSNIYSKIWKQSIDINNKDAAQYYGRALLKLEQGLVEDALLDLNKSIGIDSTNIEAIGLRALCNIHLKANYKLINNDIIIIDQVENEKWLGSYIKGYLQLQNNNLDSAEYFLLKALKLNSEDVPQINLYLGHVYFSKKDYLKAKKYYKKTVRLDHSLKDVEIKIAICNFALGREDKALYLLDAIISNDSLNVDAYVLKGDYYISINKLRHANECYRKALINDPYNIIVNFKKSYIAYEEKDYESCYNNLYSAINEVLDNNKIDNIEKKHFLWMFNISPNHITDGSKIDKVRFKQYKQGICNYLFGDYLSAQSVFSDLVLFKEDFYYVNELLGVIYISQGKYKDAVVSFQDALKFDPNSNFSNYYLGILYSQFELYSHAASCYLKALRSDPENSRLYYHLCKLNVRLNNKYAALNYLNKVIELESKNLIFVQERVVLKESMGELEDAIDDYKILIQHSPFNSLYYFEVAKLELALGNYSKAKENILTAIDLEPNSDRPLLVFANLFYQSKEYEQALAYYKKAKKMNDQYAVGCSIGFTYCKLGEYIKAIESFKEPLEFYEQTKGYGFEISDFKNVLKSYIFLGKAYEKVDLESEARSAYEKAYNLKFSGFDFFALKAKLFSDVEEYKYSVKAILNEIDSDSTNCKLYTQLGVSYKQSNQNKKALEAFNKAYYLDSLDYSVYEGLGDLYLDQKKYAEAINYYEKAKSLNKNSGYIQYKIVMSSLINGKDIFINKELVSIFKELKESEIVQIKDDLSVLSEHGVSNVEINKLKSLLDR